MGKRDRGLELLSAQTVLEIVNTVEHSTDDVYPA